MIFPRRSPLLAAVLPDGQRAIRRRQRHFGETRQRTSRAIHSNQETGWQIANRDEQVARSTSVGKCLLGEFSINMSRRWRFRIRLRRDATAIYERLPRFCARIARGRAKHGQLSREVALIVHLPAPAMHRLAPGRHVPAPGMRQHRIFSVRTCDFRSHTAAG